MSMSNVIKAIVSGELDLGCPTAMSSTPYCGVCLNDSQKRRKVKK